MLKLTPWTTLPDEQQTAILTAAATLNSTLTAATAPESIAVDAEKSLALLPFHEEAEPGLEVDYQQLCQLSPPKKKGKKRSVFFTVTSLYRFFYPRRNVSKLREKIYPILFTMPEEQWTSHGLKVTDSPNSEHRDMSYGEIAVEFCIFDYNGKNNIIPHLNALRECGANLHGYHHHGLTLLSFAVRFNQPRIALFLLQSGVRGDIIGKRPSWESDDTPALHHECFLHVLADHQLGKEHTHDLMTMLMRCHPHTDLNTPNYRGETPLHLACQSGNAPMLAELLHYGADPNIPDHEGHTPLFYCVGEFPWSFHAPLLNRGANPWICDNYGRSAIVDILSSDHVNSDELQVMLAGLLSIPPEQQLPVLFAAMHADADCLGILTMVGLPFNPAARYHGRTLLHELARTAQNPNLSGHSLFIRKYFPAPDLKDIDGNTPFLEACRYGRAAMAEALCAAGANPLIVNTAGQNAWDLLLTALTEEVEDNFHTRNLAWELTLDDHGLARLVRFLHRQCVPCYDPTGVIERIFSAYRADHLKECLQTLTFLWNECGFRMDEEELQGLFSRAFFIRHLLWSFSKEEYPAPQEIALFRAYQHAGGKLYLTPNDFHTPQQSITKLNSLLPEPMEVILCTDKESTQ